MNRWILNASLAAVAGGILAVPAGRLSIARADDAPAASAAPANAADKNPAALGQATADKAFVYLKSQQQPDYSWQADPHLPIGFTAIVLRAFMSDPKNDPDTAFLDKGFEKLESYQLSSGGIYKDSLAAYNTAIAITALATSKESEYQPAIDNALKYLRTLQWSDKIEGVGDALKVGEKDPRYGGFGYGNHERPDMSNTQFVLDAMHDAGVKPDDPAFQAALKFASRSQNRSESNDQPWAGNDGGFIYSPAEHGMSPAGSEKGPDDKTEFRSYGSMTYAGLKSMIYAGLTHDDPRVKAALEWISKNYTVSENPGMAATGPGRDGLYYYLYTMSRALSANGEPIITDANGTKHDWRVDIIDKLASLQKPDGSFVGERKWMEDNPVLATSYAVIADETAMKDLKEHPAK